MTICARAKSRGPLAIEIGDGDQFELYNMAGELIDLKGRKKILLCRCGASENRPLCDGAHNRVGFEAPEPSPEELAAAEEFSS